MNPRNKSFADSRVTTSPLGHFIEYGIISFMISEQDIEKLKEVFPTKDEFTALSKKVESHDKRFDTLETKLDTLETRFDGLQEQVGDLKVDMGEMNDKMDSLLEKIDGFVGSVHSLETENGAGAVILARHTNQIETIAKHVGLRLAN